MRLLEILNRNSMIINSTKSISVPTSEKNTSMNYIIIAALSISMLAACSQSKTADNNQTLADLQKQQEQIARKIEQLKKKSPNAGSGDTTSQANLKNVGITTLELKPFTHYINTQAIVQSDENLDVVPQSQGIYKAIYVKQGQRVSKGQALGKVDDLILQRNLSQLQTQFNLTKVLYEKRKKLWAQNIGTEVDYLQAKTNMESMQDQLATLRQQIAQTIVVSPVTGTVELVNARLGEAATPSAPGFRVVNTDILKVTAGLSETYLGRVRTGAPVVLNFSDLKKTIKGKVDFVGNTLDQNSRTFAVQTRLLNQKNIRPNMSATMRVQDYTNASALVLPVDVVQTTLDGQYVFIVKKENNQVVAQKKIVKAGLSQDGQIQIIEGLNQGDQVITTGYRGLEDQQGIKL